MVIEYKNRKGITYYLHHGKTKTGKSRYYFNREKNETLVDIIPFGYEIYENPNAQVFLRKTTPKIITEEEVQVVENGVKQFAGINDFKIDVKKNAITIFLPAQDFSGLSNILGDLPLANKEKVNEILKNAVQYSPMMRFVLTEVNTREFCVERWCFRGAIDDWINLDSLNNLQKLVQKYCHHLGKESFYNLM